MMDMVDSLRMTRDSALPCNDTSRTKVTTLFHPLRWDTSANRPRYELHNHPLRLIHSQNLYPDCNGNFVCDIGKHQSKKASYVFNCMICSFDVCLDCIAKPCYGCTSKTCKHTQIHVSLK